MVWVVGADGPDRGSRFFRVLQESPCWRTARNRLEAARAPHSRRARTHPGPCSAPPATSRFTWPPAWAQNPAQAPHADREGSSGLAASPTTRGDVPARSDPATPTRAGAPQGQSRAPAPEPPPEPTPPPNCPTETCQNLPAANQGATPPTDSTPTKATSRNLSSASAQQSNHHRRCIGPQTCTKGALATRARVSAWASGRLRLRVLAAQCQGQGAVGPPRPGRLVIEG